MKVFRASRQAVQGTIGTPILVCVHDYLGVRMTAKLVSEQFQLAAQISEVINLPHLSISLRSHARRIASGYQARAASKSVLPQYRR
jgi:hypothetical protein